MSPSPDRLLRECQESLGYRFQNVELLRTALTHSSVADTPQDSNERMEFLGDAFLGIALADTLYRRFPDYLEGPLSIVKSKVVSRRSCTVVARSLGLEKYLLVARGFDEIPDSLLANLMEAIVAAVYLDGGGGKAMRFVKRVFADAIEEAQREIHQDNFKSLLQIELHRHHPGAAAEYRLLDEKGPGHHKCFKIQVVCSGRNFQAAWGNTKKDAEQKAAENALADLHEETPPWPDGE